MKNILLKWLFIYLSLFLGTSSSFAMVCTDLTKTLSKGSENSEVLKLQQFLFDGEYLTAKPNGYFGNGTVSAVRKFQKTNGLSQVGLVGPGTRNKIKSLSCSNSSKNETLLISLPQNKNNIQIKDKKITDNSKMITVSKDSDLIYFPVREPRDSNIDGEIKSIENIKYYLLETYRMEPFIVFEDFFTRAIDYRKLTPTGEACTRLFVSSQKRDFYKDISLLDTKNYLLSFPELKALRDINLEYKKNPNSFNKQLKDSTQDRAEKFLKENELKLNETFDQKYLASIRSSYEKFASSYNTDLFNSCRIDKNGPPIKVNFVISNRDFGSILNLNTLLKYILEDGII
ncbi:MAG: peptidoglycan-binding protein [Candidatus Pacebacteria bacterium]|nr:peptidoglycan-binding protein [Candidatus Paceibacterota bacterium]MBP9866779.1 peptidoglycan-binding protein [Candidatus Paceibacterota bacterium]